MEFQLTCDIRFRLDQLGYTVTGFARDSNGHDVAVAFRVLQMGVPFDLGQFLGKVGTLRTYREGREPHLIRWRSFSLTPLPEDEVWEFRSSDESWRYLAGRAGVALVRDKVVIDTFVTVMN